MGLDRNEMREEEDWMSGDKLGWRGIGD